MGINKALMIADDVLMFEFSHKFYLFQNVGFILLNDG